jgi:hypothetical protein
MKRKMKEIRCGPDELLTKGRTEASQAGKDGSPSVRLRAMRAARLQFMRCTYLQRRRRRLPRDMHRVDLQRRCCMHNSHVHRRLYIGRVLWKLPEPRENAGMLNRTHALTVPHDGSVKSKMAKDLSHPSGPVGSTITAKRLFAVPESVHWKQPSLLFHYRPTELWPS